MPKLKTLFRAVLGLRKATTLEGRPVPSSVEGLKPVAVVHDRRLSAGLFQLRRYKRKKDPPLYRIAVWRTYSDRTGRERATSTFYLDEIDPFVDLLQKLGERITKGEKLK